MPIGPQRLGHCFVACMAGVICLAASAAMAKDDELIKPGEDTLTFRLGGFLPGFSTSVGVDVNGIGEGSANLEDLLGLDSEQLTAYADLTWRVGRGRHRVGISYFTFNRSSDFLATADVEIGDGQIIEAGAQVRTNFSFQTLPILYRYSFIKTPNQEFSGGIGVHVSQIRFAAGASAWVDDIRGDGEVTARANVPLPMLGIGYSRWLNDRWGVSIGAEGFALNVEAGEIDYSGYAYNLRVGTEYWIFNNFGIGLAFNTFGINLRLNQSNWTGKLNYRYFGPQVFLTTRF